MVSWKVATWSKAGRATFRNVSFWLLWSILVLTYLLIFVNHTLLHPSAQAMAKAGGWWTYTARGWGSGSIVEAFFTIAGILLTWMIYRISNLPDSHA